MNCKNFVATLSLMLTIVAGTSALGTQEPNHPFNATIDDRTFTFTLTGNMGSTKVNVAWDNGQGDAQIEYGLFSVDQNLKNPKTGPVDSSFSSLLQSAIGDPKPISIQDAEKVPLLSVNGSSGSFQIAQNAATALSLKGQSGTGDVHSVSLSLPSDGSIKNYILLLFTQGKFYRFQAQFQIEFFQGELTFFGTQALGEYTYAQKAAAFLDSFITASADKVDFRKIVINDLGIPMAEGNSDYWDSIESLLTNDDMYSACESAFRKAMVAQFNYGTETDNGVIMPYLLTDSESFANIYGPVAGRNIYVTAYLQFIFGKNKPILSNIIQNNLSTLTPPAGANYNYNYSDYLPLNATQGQALAKAALKYLTWGVEYTPFNGADVVKKGASTSPVYKDNYDSYIKPWIENTGDKEVGQRGDNYFPSPTVIKPVTLPGTENIAAPSLVHVLTGDFDGASWRVVGSSSTPVGVSRIDFFTSTNMAWDSSRTIGKIADSPGGEEGKRELSGSDAANSLNNKKLILDTDPKHPSNLYLQHDPTGAQPIRIGYEFSSSNQRVGGLVLVNGCGQSDPKANPDAYTLFDKIGVEHELYLQIYYEDSTGAWHQWMGEYSGGYREFVVNNHDGMIVDNSARPGWSLAAGGDYANTNKKTGICGGLTYIYISLGSDFPPCKGVALVDRVGADLDVAKLMVFPDNPVEYLTSLTAADPKTVSVYKMLGTVLNDNVSTSVKGSWAGIPSVPVGADQATNLLLTNGNPDAFFTINADINNLWWIGLSFKNNIITRSVILWDKNFNPLTPDAPDLSYEPKVIGFGVDLLSSGFFTPSGGIDAGILSSLQSLVETPYNGVTGNPLPFASEGIDSPRTFAYKMDQQVKAREWYTSMNGTPSERQRVTQEKTTSGLDSNGDMSYSEGYVSELDLVNFLRIAGSPSGGNHLVVSLGGDYHYSSTIDYSFQWPTLSDGTPVKPFLPGRTINTKTGYLSMLENKDASGNSPNNNSPFEVNKIAGVDGIGMLMGALSTSGIENAYNIFNQNVPDTLNQYYQMAAGSTTQALDANGKPIFRAASDNQSFLNFANRFTRADIEKSTVIVPDVSFIQVGDLLVKQDGSGGPYIGIIVYVPAGITFCTDLRSVWDSILVVSVRRGFQMVSLGFWGNPDGGFGGFATDPDSYQVRRMMVSAKASGDLTQKTAKDNWEMVSAIPYKVRIHYLGKVPTSQILAETKPPVASNPNTTYATDVNAQISRLKEGAVGTTESGTFYFEEFPPTSISGLQLQQSVLADDTQMLVNEFSGWRKLEIKNKDGTIATRRIEFHRGVDFSAAKGTVIKAPEAGTFYIFKSKTFGDPSTIYLPNADKLALEDYSMSAYGFIGVLLTDGYGDRNTQRVYLFMHMGDKLENAPSSDVYDAMTLAQKSEYETKYGRYPDSTEHAIHLSKGDWLGVSGDGGIGTAAHLHLEVYEFFGEDSMWQRVDPLSIFDSQLYDAVNAAGNEIVNVYGWWKKRTLSTSNALVSYTEGNPLGSLSREPLIRVNGNSLSGPQNTRLPWVSEWVISNPTTLNNTKVFSDLPQ